MINVSREYIRDFNLDHQIFGWTFAFIQIQKGIKRLFGNDFILL